MGPEKWWPMSKVRIGRIIPKEILESPTYR